MLDSEISLSSIRYAFHQYAEAPEKNGATRALKKQFNQPTVTKVLTIVKEFTNKQEIHDKKELKEWKNLYIDVHSLVEKENQHFQNGQSILHKNYWIADFFRTFFNWKYSRSEEIRQAQIELVQLQDLLHKKYISAVRKEKDPKISERLKNLCLDKENLTKGKEQFILFIEKTKKGLRTLASQKEWLDPEFIQLFSHPEFQLLFNGYTEKFQVEKYDKSHIILLHDIYLDARKRFLKHTGEEALGGDKAVQIMILVILKLPLFPSLLKLETELAYEDKVNNLNRTMADFEIAAMQIVKLYLAYEKTHKTKKGFSIKDLANYFLQKKGHGA
jgi:hypothetical protein